MANQTTTLTATAIAAEFAGASIDEIPALAARYADDPRIQVQKALTRALHRLERERAERERVSSMYQLMLEAGGTGTIVGVDEVGRGSIAGPLTVCAVCLPPKPIIWGINDSKQLSPARREILAAQIVETAVAIGFCHISPDYIDEIGMGRCLKEAVAVAVSDTGLVPDCVLMDGNPLGAVPCEKDIVHGDTKIACIAAASIVAKVTRDEMMRELDAEYPNYHFAENKGYGSAAHIEAIKQYGLSPIHRVSFCGNFLETAHLF